MELRHLRYFLAVADERNVTRAATRLGIQQPPLSQQIRELEREIGTPLFHRVPRGVELTEAGHTFLRLVQSIPAQVEGATHEARRAGRGETGELRVGFTGAASINPQVQGLLRRYRDLYPDVRLTLTEKNTVTLLDELRSHQLDAVLARPLPQHLGDLALTLVAREPMVAVVPRGHPAARTKPLPLERLRGETFITTPREFGPLIYDTVWQACRAAGFEPRLGQLAPQMLSIVSLVAAGLGVSLVPDAMRRLNLEGCEYLELRPPVPTVDLTLLCRPHERAATVLNFTALVGDMQETGPHR